VADVLDQLVPRCHERVGALLLEARGERVDVAAGRDEAGESFACWIPVRVVLNAMPPSWARALYALDAAASELRAA
jgi:hypothetical protein